MCGVRDFVGYVRFYVAFVANVAVAILENKICRLSLKSAIFMGCCCSYL